MWQPRMVVAAVVVGLLTASGATAGSGKDKKQTKSTASPGSAAVTGSSGKALAPQVGHAVRSGVSPAVRSLKHRTAAPSKDESLTRLVPNRVVRNAEKIALNRAGLEPEKDGALQAELPTPNMPAPTANFEGMSNKVNFDFFGFRVLPPDTNGDVGPNHYVQTVNLLFRVYNKSGVALTGPFSLADMFFFAGFSGNCTSDDGDPIALYDPLADRWLLSQFGVSSAPFSQCIAISQTSDPTGAYFLYDFVMVNNKFNDYPHFGVWPDGYYMTDNQFAPFFAGGGVFAFDRAKMLAGDPSASFVYFDLELLDPTIGGMLPSDLDGPPPPIGTPNYFSYPISKSFGDATDGLRVFDFHADFATPANSTFTERPESPIAVAAFDADMCGFLRNCIPQPPPALGNQNLAAISDRLMYRLQYRNFGSSESLVVTHTVDADGADHAGVRYYQLSRSGGPFSVAEQATFAPDGDNRWMGSAATDNEGNLAVGYSVSSLSTFPSIRYAGRLATDPPNGLFQGEATLVTGTGSQTSTSSRWGDYSMLGVDPVDDCRFWYTQEYYTSSNFCPTASTACWHTRVGSFKFPSCTAPATGTLSGTVQDALTGFPVSGALVGTNNGFVGTTDFGGFYSMTLPPGEYSVRASAFGYTPSVSASVAVDAGGTSTVNLELAPTPVLAIDSSAIDDSALAGGNANGVIDRSECVNVNVTLRNDSPTGNATSVAALLTTTTPNVTVGTGSGYPTLFSGGGTGTNTTPFKLSTSSAFVAGTPISLTLTVTTAQGTFTLPFTVQTGALLAPSTFSATGPVAIPDDTPAGVDLPITVSGFTGSIGNVTLTMFVTHTFDGDLQVSLIAPDGTTVPLSTNKGGGGANFGTDCPADGNDTIFDDAAGTSIGGGAAPFVGTFRPESPLSAFNGKSGAAVNGTWKLHVADVAAIDVGNIECATLSLAKFDQTAGPGPCNVSSLSITPSVTTTEGDATGNFPTMKAVFTVTLAPASASTVFVNFTTLPGTATLGTSCATGVDLRGGGVGGAQTGSRTFFPGQTVKTITVPICGDRRDEATETYTVRLLGATGAIIANADGVGQISDNETRVDFDKALGPPSTFSATGPVAIPDATPAGVDLPITVSGFTGSIGKVTLTMFLTHTFDADLDVSLIGPDGTTVLLSSGEGGSGDNFGTDCPADGNDTTFDDGGTPIFFGSAPFVGTFRPELTLSALNGKSGAAVNGTWKLHVADFFLGDVGNIECAKLSLSPVGASAGKADILWRNQVTGQNAMFLMDGPTIATPSFFASITDLNWQVAGVGDFNGDGKADIFWRDAPTGDNALWLMNGTTIVTTAFFSSIPSDWVVGGVGDFNGDTKADILWRNTTTGQIAIWLMNGTSVSSPALIGSLPTDWVAGGVADFSGDGKADILWRNTTTGANAIWLMSGFTITSSGLIASIPDTNYFAAGVGDFNDNGRADILWRNRSTGDIAIWLMNGTSIDASAFIGNLDIDWKGGVADFDGNGKADILWRNTVTGDIAMWLMNGTSISSTALVGNLDTAFTLGAP